MSRRKRFTTPGSARLPLFRDAQCLHTSLHETHFKAMLIRHRITLSVLLAAFIAMSGCTSMQQPMQTVPHVDLPRYMGDWYVIANIPYFAEKDCVDSIESYALRPDGKIDNWFTCRKKSFDAPMKRKATAVATVKDTATNATWSVGFFKVISVKYLILVINGWRWATRREIMDGSCRVPSRCLIRPTKKSWRV
jgi:lipocalin